MAKSSARPDQTRGFNLNWRYVVSAGLLSLLLMSVFFAWQQVDQFLIRDPRFMLARPAEYGEESPNLHITGLRYASRGQVLRIFQQDIGRSIYLFPLKERRRALLRIGWIKDASIVRTWPDEISIRVTERQPAAFIQLRGDSISRWGLIDSDGVMLDPPARSSFNLPVITGVSPDETTAMRGVRVRRMSRMLDDIRDFRKKVSEIDVSDLDNLKVTLKMGDRAVVLMLGDQNFRSRFQSFFDHYDEIKKRMSEMTTLDLRLDDRITVVGGKRE